MIEHIEVCTKIKQTKTNNNSNNMSTYLDQTRLLHVELEQNIKSIVYEFQNKAKTVGIILIFSLLCFFTNN